MTQIDTHLRLAQLHLHHATRELEIARGITITDNYGTNYKLAIDRALVQSHETWLHIGNTRDHFRPPAAPAHLQENSGE